MSFTRSGKAPKETYLAMIRAFQLPVPADLETLTELIAKAAIPKQFKVLEIKHEAFSGRKYPCVRTISRMVDTGAFSGRESLELQWYAVTCRHPDQQDLGFEVSFSHRGDSPDVDLEREALAFIEGVQVPEVRPVVAANVPRSFDGTYKWRDSMSPMAVYLFIERVEADGKLVRFFGSHTYGLADSRVKIEGEIDSTTRSVTIREFEPSKASMVTDGHFKGTISNDLQGITAIWINDVTGPKGDYRIRAKDSK